MAGTAAGQAADERGADPYSQAATKSQAWRRRWREKPAGVAFIAESGAVHGCGSTSGPHRISLAAGAGGRGKSRVVGVTCACSDNTVALAPIKQ